MTVNAPNHIKAAFVGTRGPKGETGPAGNSLPAVYFSYGDATPAILFTPQADLVIVAVKLVVLIPFNGVAPKVSIGTTAVPNLLMDEDETYLSEASTYETNPYETLSAGTPVKVFITPGSGATAGRCMVFIEYAQA